MGFWFQGKKGSEAQDFGKSTKKARKSRLSFMLEEIITPSTLIPGVQDTDPLRQLLGSLPLSDWNLGHLIGLVGRAWVHLLQDVGNSLHFMADAGGTCPTTPAPTGDLPPLIDLDPLGLRHEGIPTQVPGTPGGAWDTLTPPFMMPLDPPGDGQVNKNQLIAIDPKLLDFPLADQPIVGAIETGVSVNSPYLDYSKIKLGRDYIDGDEDPLLQPGQGSEHGTFIVGIIDSINKNAPKWVGRAIGSGKWADSLIDFVNDANLSGQKNAIINLSLDLTQKNPDGSVTTRYEFTPFERAALEYARQHGVMIVVAAGNDGDVMSVLGQASQEFDNIITVGSGDVNGEHKYSGDGRGLNIMADGGTTENPVLSTVGSGLGTMAGTSVATAKVTGAASLVWAANPDLSYRQVIDILEKTARDLGTPGWDDETGFGLLNTLAAVQLAKNTTPEVYNPKAILTPNTWGGDGKVTPGEKAVNFNGTIDWGKTAVQINGGVNLRNGPGTGYDFLGRISSGDTLEFDSQTEGDFVNDPNGEGSSSTWYHLADGSGWMSGLYVQYLGEIASPSPSPDPSPSPSPNPSPSPSPDPSPSPSPNPSPSPISTFSQIVQDVGYVHDLGYLRVRSGPGTDASGYQKVGIVSPGDTLIFDGQTQGESVYDPALGESTSWYHLADGSGWVSGLYMGAASTPTPSPSPSPTQPNPFEDVRRLFLDAARQYPQVGNAITDVQDQGGGVFRQEFERAIMYWNGQQVTIYETKGQSTSPISLPSEPAPVSNNGGGLLQTVNTQYFLARPQFYITGNPFFPYNAPVSVGGTGGLAANCTWYASGRVKEMGGSPEALSSMLGNAGTWGNNLSNGSQIVYQPQVGDVAEWTRDGHVAVVEQVNSDGSIVISESNYAGILHNIRTIYPGQVGTQATGWPERFIRVPKNGSTRNSTPENGSTGNSAPGSNGTGLLIGGSPPKFDVISAINKVNPEHDYYQATRNQKGEITLTKCNWFVADVLDVLGVKLPEYYQVIPSSNLIVQHNFYPTPHPIYGNNSHEKPLLADQLFAYFTSGGGDYPGEFNPFLKRSIPSQTGFGKWNKVSATDAVSNAQNGEIVVACEPKDGGHIAIVLPNSSENDIRIAQAGPTNFKDGPLTKGWSSSNPSYFVYDPNTHSTYQRSGSSFGYNT